VKASYGLLPLVIAYREVGNQNLKFAFDGLNDSFGFFEAISSTFCPYFRLIGQAYTKKFFYCRLLKSIFENHR
jgi:hypothetical protein